jgi:hypothetical protein
MTFPPYCGDDPPFAQSVLQGTTHHDISRSGISATAVSTGGTNRPYNTRLPTDLLAVQMPYLCKKRGLHRQFQDPRICNTRSETLLGRDLHPLHMDYRKATGRDSCTIALPAHKKYTALTDQVYPARCRAVVIQRGLKCKTQGGGV